MKATEAIRSSIETSDMITKMYLEDLNDQEMLHRPHEKCNHVNWQVGHLILSDHQMLADSCPGKIPALPDGFSEKYAKEAATKNDLSEFCNKDELMQLFAEQRQAVFSALASMSDEELSAESPEAVKSYAPTVGSAFAMIGVHWMMHAGQWAVIRRQLGREVIM